MSVSLSGVPFSPPHDLLLKAMQRANGLEGSVWVSSQMAALLHLPLRPTCGAAVALSCDTSTHLYHHSSDYAVDLDEMCRRWRLHQMSEDAKRSPDPLLYENERRRDALRRRAQRSASFPGATISSSHSWRPADANGEPFPPAVEAAMLTAAEQWVSAVGTLPSPYWVSAQEAAYVFQSPVKKVNATKSCGVDLAVAVPRVCAGSQTPILYHNAYVTERPAVYNALNCVRYDPYNFCGAFYSPVFAVMMKRYAVQHGCVQEQRWLTPSRIIRMKVNPQKGIPPLTVVVGGGFLRLCNIALTTNPNALEDRCIHAASDEVVDAAEDAALLLRRHPDTVELDDALDNDVVAAASLF